MIKLGNEFNKEDPINRQNDPIHDIDLMEILGFDLPTAGIYHNGLLEIKYIWEGGQKILRYALLRINCNRCGKTTETKISRQKIILNKDCTTDKCYSVYCDHCHKGGEVDRRYFISRDFKKIDFQDTQAPPLREQRISPIIYPKEQVSKKKKEPKHEVSEEIIRTININDISDIAILKFINSLKKRNIIWCTLAILSSDFEDIRIYLNQIRNRAKRNSFILHLRNLIADLVDRKLLKHKPSNFSPRFASYFRLTTEGKNYIKNWKFLKKLDNPSKLQECVKEIFKFINIDHEINQTSVFKFVFELKKQQNKKWISANSLKEEMHQIQDYYKRVDKIRETFNNFPIEKYFTVSYSKKELDNCLKILFKKQLDSILENVLEELVRNRHLKKRKKMYRLTWDSEIHGID